MPPTEPDAPTLPPPPPGEVTLNYVAPASAAAQPAAGGYDLLGEIARGGMGVVYRARQRGLDRIVALKMVLSGTFASTNELRRFRGEAEAAARLDHPNIVPVYDVGESDGRPFFTMAFVAGGSLADRLAAGPLPPREAADLVAQIADAVQYAHEQGIVHRDLKPANVLLDERGTPKVTDFGLAKRQQGGDGPTNTGDVMGTPAYMPPEQADGRAAYVGPAADVYSLGAVLFALLTGRPPFVAPTPLDTVLQVLNESPPRPRLLRPEVPRDLETVCLKCLEKDPTRRYATAKELGDDLRRFLAGEPVRARRAGLVRRGRAWLRKRPAALVVAAAALLVGVSALAYGLRAAIRDRDWRIEYLAIKAERLGLPANPPDADIQALAGRLRALAAVRPDQRLYGEALGLLRAQGKAVRRVPLGPHEGDAAKHFTLHRPRGKKVRFVPFRWDREGRRIDVGTFQFDAATGASTRMQIDGVNALADPTGQWLARFATESVWLRHRPTGRDHRIELDAAKLVAFDFTPGGHRLMLVTEGGPGGRRIELHDPAGDRPAVFAAVPAAGALLWAASADGSRLAWCCDGEPSIAVVRTDDGTTLATVPRPGAAQPLRGLALSPDGRRVVWSETEYSDRAPPIAIGDVATGEIVARLAAPDPHMHLSHLTFSPDGCRVYGTASGGMDVHDGVAGEGLYKVMAWDAATGRLRVWVPGDDFATEAGPAGELAVVHGNGPGEKVLLHIDLWSLDAAEAGVEAMGLAGNLAAEETTALAVSRIADRLAASMLFAVLGFAAVAAVLLSQFWQRVVGRPATRWVAAAAALAGLVAVAGGLTYQLTTFDLAGWEWWEAGSMALVGLMGVATGVGAVWIGVLNLRAAGTTPGGRVPTAGELRANALGLALLSGSVVAGLTFTGLACRDGLVLGAGVTGLVNLTLAACLVFLVSGSVVWAAAARRGRAATVVVPARRAWLAVAVVAGLWCAGAVARRAWQPPRWPAEIGRGAWVAWDGPLALLAGDALAAGLLAVAVLARRRSDYALGTSAAAQAASSADSGGSGGAA